MQAVGQLIRPPAYHRQKGTIALKLLSLREQEAKERQIAAGKLYGENHPKQEVPASARKLLKQNSKVTPAK